MIVTRSSTIMNVLVVGANGDTGKHVVRQLLNQGHQVNAIVRSKQRMLEALPKQAIENNKNELLTITEGSVMDMSDSEIAEHVRNADAVVTCLGHRLTFSGIFGHPRTFVTESNKRLTKSLILATSAATTSSDETEGETKPKKKFILMGSAGVANPDGTDDRRTFIERAFLFAISYLMHDNEGAAAHLHSLGKNSGIEWSVVRPTNLIDGETSTYEIFEKPIGPLFGDGMVATRANVAKFMVDMITNSDLWGKWKFQHPVIHDAKLSDATAKEL